MGQESATTRRWTRGYSIALLPRQPEPAGEQAGWPGIFYLMDAFAENYPVAFQSIFNTKAEEATRCNGGAQLGASGAASGVKRW